MNGVGTRGDGGRYEHGLAGGDRRGPERGGGGSRTAWLLGPIDGHHLRSAPSRGPLVAVEPRLEAAVLGLMGISGPDHYQSLIRAAAARIHCPVLFVMQLEDELFARDACLALFDAIASDNKRLHANPGLHPAVPVEELDASFSFLVSHLVGTAPARDVAFKVAE